MAGRVMLHHLVDHRHILGMATYTIVQRPNREGFDVEVMRDGKPETTSGFETQAAAERWIVIDTRLRCHPDQGSNFRMLWRF